MYTYTATHRDRLAIITDHEGTAYTFPRDLIPNAHTDGEPRPLDPEEVAFFLSLEARTVVLQAARAYKKATEAGECSDCVIADLIAASFSNVTTEGEDMWTGAALEIGEFEPVSAFRYSEDGQECAVAVKVADLITVHPLRGEGLEEFAAALHAYAAEYVEDAAA